jgi:hypothetical protein
VSNYFFGEEKVPASYLMDGWLCGRAVRDAKGERKGEKGISRSERPKRAKGIVDIRVEEPIGGARPEVKGHRIS